MSPASEREFSIKDQWAGLLWLPGSLAAAAFGGAFLFILPMAMPAAPKAAAALLLGASAAGLSVYRLKLAHYLRHAAEAGLLGFRCRPGRPIWNPFAPLETLLAGGPDDPEEARLLAGLVRMHGPDYGHDRGKAAWSREAALVSAVLIVFISARFPGALPALYPLFGLTALCFLLAGWELLLGRVEAAASLGERLAPPSPGAAYTRWNFLTLEAQREAAGRLPAMRTEIARVLLVEAGLKPGDAVLETGSGGGFLWKHIPPALRENWTQAEKDPYACLYARRHGNGSAFALADAAALPFPAASFDAITGLECFDSLSAADLGLFLREAMRVLRPGGRLVHLKDFPDWPGGPLAEEFNAFSMRALRRELVRRGSGLSFRYEKLGGDDIRELSRAAAAAGGRDGRIGRVLAGVYSAGTGSDPRFGVPMFVSAMLLAEEFSAAGFEPGGDSFSLPPGRETALAYVIARKPA